ncbi:hypothetical protein R0J89_17050, partial [Psychrobacter sp. SIMBA_152]
DAKELEDFVEKVSSEAKEVRALLEATDKSLASIAEELENAGLPSDIGLINSDVEIVTSRISELRARIESYGSRFVTTVEVSLAGSPDDEE